MFTSQFHSVHKWSVYSRGAILSCGQKLYWFGARIRKNGHHWFLLRSRHQHFGQGSVVSASLLWPALLRPPVAVLGRRCGITYPRMVLPCLTLNSSTHLYTVEKYICVCLCDCLCLQYINVYKMMSTDIHGSFTQGG